MPFPKTRRAMIDAGYSFEDLKTCPCGVTFERWRTPTGSYMPIDAMGLDDNAKAVTHFSTCPMAAQFRRAKPSDAKAAAHSQDQLFPDTPAAPAAGSPPAPATPASRAKRSEPNGERG